MRLVGAPTGTGTDTGIGAFMYWLVAVPSPKRVEDGEPSPRVACCDLPCLFAHLAHAPLLQCRKRLSPSASAAPPDRSPTHCSPPSPLAASLDRCVPFLLVAPRRSILPFFPSSPLLVLVLACTSLSIHPPTLWFDRPLTQSSRASRTPPSVAAP